MLAAYLAITELVGFCVLYKVMDVDSRDVEATYHSGEDPFDGRGGD